MRRSPSDRAIVSRAAFPANATSFSLKSLFRAPRLGRGRSAPRQTLTDPSRRFFFRADPFRTPKLAISTEPLRREIQASAPPKRGTRRGCHRPRRDDRRLGRGRRPSLYAWLLGRPSAIDDGIACFFMAQRRGTSRTGNQADMSQPPSKPGRRQRPRALSPPRSEEEPFFSAG